MARPAKFRLTPDDVLDPPNARKLAGHVSEIEFFRSEVEKLQAQIAGVYDAADEEGFDKKFIRKVVAIRAKDDAVAQAEQAGIDAYTEALEIGFRSRARVENPEHDAETGEVTSSETNHGGDHETAAHPEHYLIPGRRLRADSGEAHDVAAAQTGELQRQVISETNHEPAEGSAEETSATYSEPEAAMLPQTVTATMPVGSAPELAAVESSEPIRRMSMTPLEPREAGGLKGFGFTVRFDEPEAAMLPQTAGSETAVANSTPGSGAGTVDAGEANWPSEMTTASPANEPETIPPVADPATVVSEAANGDSAPSLAAIPVADRSQPNPICRDPDDCGVYASWAMPCQVCKAAAAHRSAA